MTVPTDTDCAGNDLLEPQAQAARAEAEMGLWFLGRLTIMGRGSKIKITSRSTPDGGWDLPGVSRWMVVW